MSYPEVLADLKARFGNKLLLTATDIAEAIGKDTRAQASHRYRARQKGKPKDKDDILWNPEQRGKRLKVSIHAVARYIVSGDPSEEASSAPSERTPSARRVRAPKASGAPDPSRPTRRPPSLGKVLRDFQRGIVGLERELAFRRELVAELERVELERHLDKGRAKRAAAPAKPKGLRV